MSTRSVTFRQLIDRIKGGDREALQELYAEYGGVVREAVRHRLPDRLRKEYDSLDFVHDVWASFCALGTEELRFEEPQDLGAFLVRVARNKVIDVCRRRLQTQAHDARREQPIARDGQGSGVAVAGPGATPSQWAIAAERWAEITAKLPAPHAAVLARLREGYSQAEVATMAGISDRTVRRIVERVREICRGDV